MPTSTKLIKLNREDEKILMKDLMILGEDPPTKDPWRGSSHKRSSARILSQKILDEDPLTKDPRQGSSHKRSSTRILSQKILDEDPLTEDLRQGSFFRLNN
jgi:hypothetical protein